MTFVLTSHAIQRYRERFAPHLSEEDARIALQDLLVYTGTDTGRPAREGRTIWTCFGGIRCVVAVDRCSGQRYVLTVLAPMEIWTQEERYVEQ